MIARIKTDSGFYDSVVFARFDGGLESKVLVFNRDKTELRAVREYTSVGHRVMRHVFIYNTEVDGDMIKTDKTEGYSFIFEFCGEDVFRKQITDPAVIDKCMALQSDVTEPEWIEIKTEADIEGLLSVVFNFHNSTVKSVYKRAGKRYVRFDTPWCCEILFELDGEERTNLYKGHGRIVDNDPASVILGASVFFDDGLTYWVDEPHATKKEHIDKVADYYFCAEKVKWKLIV